MAKARQPRPPHQLEYARELPPQRVYTGAGEAAVMLLVWAGTICINLALLVWLVVDLKARLETAAGGVAAILIFVELIGSLCWASLLIVAARRFGRRNHAAGKSLVLYWRGKTVLALVAFLLNTCVSVFDLPGDKDLGMMIWISAIAGLMVTGLLGMGYRQK